MDNDIQKKIADFFKQYKRLEYKKNEILIQAEEDPQGIFYLQQGSVTMYLVTKNDEKLLLNLLKPDAFFPMSWAVGIKNPYYFEATEEVIVLCAPKNDVLTFLKENPQVMFNLLTRLYKGFDGILTRNAHLMVGNAHARLISELLISAKRFGKNDNGSLSFTLNLRELNLSFGMKHEIFDTEMKILQEKGIVIHNDMDMLIIPDIGKLESELTKGL